jgi:protein-tyrosine-phosphatase
MWTYGETCDPKSMSTPTIHFFCTGNIYRSRLAEAYCASRCAGRARVSSSGIAAGANGNAPISPYAASVLAKHGLDSFAAGSWQQTTEALVKATDVLVLMESEHHRFCNDWIEAPRQRIEVWEIEDIGPMAKEAIPGQVEQTFERIRRRTDALLQSLGLASEL